MLRDEIYQFIQTYNAKYRRPPTIREILAGTNASSTSHVLHHLKALDAEGKIEYIEKSARGIILK